MAVVWHIAAATMKSYWLTLNEKCCEMIIISSVLLSRYRPLKSILQIAVYRPATFSWAVLAAHQISSPLGWTAQLKIDKKMKVASWRLHLFSDTRYCTCYFMLLFLPETLGAVINVAYYETPEGFCCDDGHSRPEDNKASTSVCFLAAFAV